MSCPVHHFAVLAGAVVLASTTSIRPYRFVDRTVQAHRERATLERLWSLS